MRERVPGNGVFKHSGAKGSIAREIILELRRKRKRKGELLVLADVVQRDEADDERSRRREHDNRREEAAQPTRDHARQQADDLTHRTRRDKEYEACEQEELQLVIRDIQQANKQAEYRKGTHRQCSHLATAEDRHEYCDDQTSDERPDTNFRPHIVLCHSSFTPNLVEMRNVWE
jgi:hypothetical protein